MTKRLMCFLLPLAFLLTSCGGAESAHEKFTVACMDFPSYDIARAVCGDAAEVIMVVPPDADLHSHVLTLSEVAAVQNCDLLIYNGGEASGQTELAVESADREIEVLRLVDCVSLLDGESNDGMHHDEHGHEHGHEADVHVYTSQENAIRLCGAVCERLCLLDKGNADAYKANCAEYQGRLLRLKNDFTEFFDGLQSRVLVIGDVYPFRYFAEEYGLTCFAAFSGCADGDVAPSLSSLAVLSEKIRQYGVKTVFYTEFSSQLTARCIASENGTDTMLLRACYNVERDRFAEGVTYIDLMYENLQTLREVMH